MENYSTGKNLLSELLSHPEEFNADNYKGYDLLNEYLRGMDIETIIPILNSENKLVYRIGISICSELDENQCSVILPYLLHLVGIEDDPLYLNYLFGAIYNGTCKKNCEKFCYIVRHLNSTEYKIISSAMHLMVVANDKQLEASISELDTATELSLIKGLQHLTGILKLDKDKIVQLIQCDDPIMQLFAGIISAKLYTKYPDLIRTCAVSLNKNLQQFSEEIIELNM